MGQMVESLGFPSRTASAALALFSVSQAIARVAVGTLSDAALHWNVCGWEGVPRPAFLVVLTTLGIVSHSILAVATRLDLFVVGVVVSGMAFGMVWPLMVLLVGEVFGTVNHGANYMFFDGFTSAIGTLLISKFLVSAVYETHIDVGDGNGDDITCYGRGCFGMSHVAVVLLSTTCLVTSVAVWINTKPVYDRRRQQIARSPDPQRMRSVDELYGSPYATWRKRDAIRF